MMVLAYCAILFVLASVFVVPVDRVAAGGFGFASTSVARASGVRPVNEDVLDTELPPDHYDHHH